MAKATNGGAGAARSSSASQPTVGAATPTATGDGTAQPAAPKATKLKAHAFDWTDPTEDVRTVFRFDDIKVGEVKEFGGCTYSQIRDRTRAYMRKHQGVKLQVRANPDGTPIVRRAA